MPNKFLIFLRNIYRSYEFFYSFVVCISKYFQTHNHARVIGKDTFPVNTRIVLAFTVSHWYKLSEKSKLLELLCWSF